MKPGLVVSAAILLGAALAGGASAQDVRSPSGQSYSVSLSGAVTCSVNFLEDEGDQSAWVMVNCDPNSGRYPEGLATQWRLEGERVSFMLDTGDPATARFFAHDCELWPDMAVGETATEACWINSGEGGPSIISLYRVG
ncbi:hypothetical protein ACFELO_02110 [Oceanicaulis sp. LC35]|uniref:hypothetical protein n=1 Tax=Oceanicaulis sp. LC35 TaxID=3349635 RepID=UPI003F8505C3